MMGDIFVSVVSIIIAASVFATGEEFGRDWILRHWTNMGWFALILIEASLSFIDLKNKVSGNVCK